jgi:hypothetical protein
LIAIQVKHKQRGSKNEGQIQRVWENDYIPFDVLVFYQPSKRRGVIAPRRMLKKEGGLFSFFNKDEDGYATGSPRKMWKDFYFEIPTGDELKAAEYFAERFAAVVLAEKMRITEPSI